MNIYKTLKSIFTAATKWKVISRNPMDGVDRPVADKQEKRALKSKKHSYTTTEAKELILELMDEPEHWRLYYLGVLLGGFRRSEMLAVQWHHIDFESGSIHIQKQISLTEDGKLVEKEVKTEESAAFVPMPKWYLTELKQFKRRWLAERFKLSDKWNVSSSQYVFHNRCGQPIYPTVPTYDGANF